MASDAYHDVVLGAVEYRAGEAAAAGASAAAVVAAMTTTELRKSIETDTSLMLLRRVRRVNRQNR